MAVKRILLFTAGAFAVGITARHFVVSRQPSTLELEGPRWRKVTIFHSRDVIAPDGVMPQPLLRLGQLVDVKMEPAPGDRGTELSARLRAAEPTGVTGLLQRVRGIDPRQAVRRALRESKQLLEAGEIIRIEPQPHGRRRATPGGAAVDLLAHRSPGGGVL
jgi:hypothetical protein